jgi:hypothetical protein
MGFLLALLGYLAGVTVAIVAIVASVAYLVPGPQSPREATEISGQQKSAKSGKPTPRETTRQLAARAAARL